MPSSPAVARSLQETVHEKHWWILVVLWVSLITVIVGNTSLNVMGALQLGLVIFLGGVLLVAAVVVYRTLPRPDAAA